MKIRRRGHPTQPSTGNHAPNSHTPRMTRASHDLYNHNGDPIDRDEIQAAAREATLDCIVLHTSDVDARAIHDATDKTITFIGDNSLTYVMGNAFSTDPPDFTDDGEIPFKFAGNAARKQ